MNLKEAVLNVASPACLQLASFQAGCKLPLGRCINPQHLTNVTATSNDSAHSSPNTHFHMRPRRYDMKV